VPEDRKSESSGAEVMSDERSFAAQFVNVDRKSSFNHGGRSIQLGGF